MRILHPHRLLLLVLTTAFTICASAKTRAQGRPSPVMEMTSVVSGLGIQPNGILTLENSNVPLTTVFLPRGASVEAVLTREGDARPLHIQDFYIQHVTDVFARIDTRGKYQEFRFREPGDYILTYRSNGQTLSRIAFTASIHKSGDPFAPQTTWYTTGPWNRWAYFTSRLKDGATGQIGFHMWAMQNVKSAGTQDADTYRVTLKKDGDIVAISPQNYVAATQWRNLEFLLSLPESKGGRAFTLQDLLARDGTYHFVVAKNESPTSVFAFSVENGKPVLHPAHDSNYQPRAEYIVPRFPDLAAHGRGAGNMLWMERMDDQAAQQIADAGPAATATPSEAQRKRWNWLPTSIDPQRKLKLVLTDIPTRSDTHIAAGEDLIAFGTGFPTGVKYLQVGDSQAREIPGSERFLSTLFYVAGKKIVLVHKDQLSVFNTETGKLHSVPSSEITLNNPVGGLHRGNQLKGDGYLVATVNRAEAVSDGNIIKVLDISGDVPVVISIKNADYTARQVSSVAVSAKQGIVAVSSSELGLVTIASVAPLANQKVFDVSEFRGVGRQQIFVEDDALVYCDKDRKVRLLSPRSEFPTAITDQPLGSSSNGFFVRKGRLVVMTQTHTGTRFQTAISDLPDAPKLVANTGKAIETTSGGLGMGGVAALASDKTVFIAGTPSGGIGVGEYLQAFDSQHEQWRPLRTESGELIQAIDVTTSMGLLAFKTGDRQSPTTIGYATYGERVTLPSSTSSNFSSTMSKQPIDLGSQPLELVEDNPYATKDEQSQALLQSFLETEQNVREAFVAAFGKQQGETKAIETVLDNLKQSGQQSLIPAYLQQSKLATPELVKKYKSEEGAAKRNPVSQEAVLNALKGQWQAIRFNAKGQDLPDSAIESIRLTLADGRFVLSMGNAIQTGTYRISSDQAPFQMDLQIESGPNQGEQRLGSFQLLKRGYLLMAFGTNPDKRPSRFVPDSSGEQILVAYQKVQ